MAATYEWGYEFTKEENEVVDLSHALDEPACLSEVWAVEKVLRPVPVSMKALRTTMLNLWRTNQKIEIHDFGVNLFTVRFFSAEDRTHVLDAGTWSFDRTPIILRELDGDEDPETVNRAIIPFWVQIHGLPMGMRSELVARTLGGHFAGYLGWDSNDQSRLSASIRIRALIDTSKPLLQGKSVATGPRGPLRVTFQYERLTSFCFRCGFLTHLERECKAAAPIAGSGSPFGPLMRAEMPRNASTVVAGSMARDNRTETRQNREAPTPTSSPPHHAFPGRDCASMLASGGDRQREMRRGMTVTLPKALHEGPRSVSEAVLQINEQVIK